MENLLMLIQVGDTSLGADLGGGGRGGRGPPFQFVGDLFFVKIYNNFIILLAVCWSFWFF